MKEEPSTMNECQCDPDVWGPDGLERGTGHNPVCPNYRTPMTPSKTERELEELLRAADAVVTYHYGDGDKDRDITDAVPALLAERKLLRRIVAEAATYREHVNGPECYGDSGPYCGEHSFLEYSSLIDEARSLLAEQEGHR